MTISYTPTSPVVDDEITLSLVGEDSDRWDLTAVPEESSLSIGELVDANGDAINTFTPDVPGVYSVAAYEVVEHAAPSSFPGDPATSWTEFSQADTGSIEVGEVLSLAVATKFGHSANISITIHDEVVTAAEITSPSSDQVRVAGQQATVVAALAALINKTVDTDLGDVFITRINDLRTQYEAHRQDATVHNSADTTNVISHPAADTGLEGALRLLGEMAEDIVQHMTMTTDAAWHNKADMNNGPITTMSPFLTKATVFLADLTERGYERHRIDAAVHNSADTTNDMSAPAVLTSAIVALLDELADLTPTVPTGEQEGAVDARQLFGFE